MEPNTNTSNDYRRYRILGVLGHGGFGTVYHARMEGSDGFVKEVAIKLLSDPNPPPETLSRFRDEARILGRLRDRAIVTVDPPTRLHGRWAVVMEFVDGIDCRRALREHSRLPPEVALGIIFEVARTLHNLWTHIGEDGVPMHLLHRDIKPSNIQITPNGDVKLLDFGVARADFEHRESTTSSHIAGTRGYIAPERLEGVEDHRGDIYSLGVVLEELLTGLRPSLLDSAPPLTFPWPIPDEILVLARAMRDPDPAARPTAEQVERRSTEILRSLEDRSETPLTLRSWARDHVHPRLSDPQSDTKGKSDSVADDLVGQTLSHTLPRISFDATPNAVRYDWRPLLSLLLLLVSASAALLVVLLGTGVLGTVYYVRIQSPALSVPAIEAPAIEAPLEPEEPIPPGTVPPDVLPVEPAIEAPVAADPPKPKRKVKSPPKVQTGTISQTGADSIELVGTPGRFGSGRVPVGRYTVYARFSGSAQSVPAGTFDVTSGARIVLRCDARFQRCLLE